MKKLEPFCRRINYKYNDFNLLIQALTHCSADAKNNERLEFLGDSILNMVITEALYSKFTNEKEGQLSRLRASLVNGESLATIAKEIQLGDFLYLGQGELKTGGFRRESILADALEAIFASIYLDGGITACKNVILSLYASRLEDEATLLKNLKDYKTQLQEYLQSNKLSLPIYTLIKITEMHNEQIFEISCLVPDKNLTAKGIASTRKKAEQIAAKLILKSLKIA